MSKITRIIKNYKIYFIYPDKLRKTVSIITGIFIAFYSALSGILTIFIICRTFIDGNDIAILEMLLYVIIGLPVGILILALNLWLTNLISGKTEIEPYSYIRLVLFISISAYLALLITAIIIFLTNFGLMKF